MTLLPRILFYLARRNRPTRRTPKIGRILSHPAERVNQNKLAAPSRLPPALPEQRPLNEAPLFITNDGRVVSHLRVIPHMGDLPGQVLEPNHVAIAIATSVGLPRRRRRIEQARRDRLVAVMLPGIV